MLLLNRRIPNILDVITISKQMHNCFFFSTTLTTSSIIIHVTDVALINNEEAVVTKFSKISSGPLKTWLTISQDEQRV